MIMYEYPYGRDTWCSINHIYGQRHGKGQRGRYMTKEGAKYIEGWMSAFASKKPEAITSDPVFFDFRMEMYLSEQDFYYKNGNIYRIDVQNYTKPVEDSYINWLKLMGHKDVDDRCTVRWESKKFIGDRTCLVLYVGHLTEPVFSPAPPRSTK